ncbi:MAG: hypothetical protein JRJ12_12200 [Deltaproteobacteria bacterium]|nr:hypothetical protein [Deltaproteobacteria bacterium]MBW2072296.1 hypothetical protein [Deltaproteobacteria bacterium]
MSPFIRDGDVITVSPLPRGSLRCGDVLAFVHPATKKLVIHRLVGQRRGILHTKGDNSGDAEELIAETNILGCVTRVERHGKKVLFGLGLERRLIAFFNKRNLLLPLLTPLRGFIGPLKKTLLS